jgi:hypothetical protein
MGSTQTSTTKERWVTGMFNDPESADRAYQSLRSRGYTDREINVIMSDDTRDKHFKAFSGAKTLEGAGAGSVAGGATGAVVGAIVGSLAAIVLPGIGLVIAGPLAGALAGAGAGGAAGGLVGGLIGAGIPEDRAKLYDSGVRAGGIFMGVRPKNEEDARTVQNEWRTHRGEQIHY